MDWTIDFSQFLRSLEQHPNFESIIKGLKNPGLYYERMTVLDFAKFLFQAGFEIRFDKGVDINGTSKKPDLFVQTLEKGSEFYVEISELFVSDKEREANDVFHKVIDLFMYYSPRLAYSGRLERILSPKHLEEIMTKIKDILDLASNKQTIQTLEIEGVIRFAAAPLNMEKSIQVWAEQFGMEAHQFSGPSHNTSEISRIAFKLEKEQKQLPASVPNVVIIHCPLLSMEPWTNSYFQSVANAVEEAVFKYPHIAYVGLISRWQGRNENNIYRWKEHLSLNRSQYGFLCDSLILLKNRFAEKPMPKAIEDKFLAAFSNGT
jgi:hypothetical protein